MSPDQFGREDQQHDAGDHDRDDLSRRVHRSCHVGFGSPSDFQRRRLLPCACSRKPGSSSDSTLISTLEIAPSSAARASAVAVVRSELHIGVGDRLQPFRNNRPLLSRAGPHSAGRWWPPFSAAAMSPPALRRLGLRLLVRLHDRVIGLGVGIDRRLSVLRAAASLAMASLNCASYCDKLSCLATSRPPCGPDPPAIAPAAAAALPPPGVAVGAASCSMKGSTPARSPPTAILPLITASRRFSRISDESKFSICRNHSAADSKAFFGINPTISLLTACTP